MSLTQHPPANPMTYLKDLQKLQREVEADLRERCDQVPELLNRLKTDYQAARDRGRTSSTYEAWRDEYVTQSAAAWVLACVFVRYLEDHDLIEEVWLAGEPAVEEDEEDRMQRALDAHESYFQRFPGHSDREYLEHVFRSVAQLPGCGSLFGEDRNPLWQMGVSGDMARKLLAFFQARDPKSGRLLRPFRTEEGDTRFLGDLYQDLSEHARKRYALLQTPDFVEEFILDRTLTPAIEEFGLGQVRMIDPACGSGHFLLGAFHRLFALWRDREPGGNPREWARKAAEAVHGVDLNPFAAAIARFRLLVAYLRACQIKRLRDAPDVKLHVAAGDSLIYERRVDSNGNPYLDGLDWTPEPFLQGDYEDACAILRQRYHVVVGNPPYITDKDPEHREFVRLHYASAFKQFSLGVPFTERLFELGARDGLIPAGFIGLITSNSFMKREFGRYLIEKFLPRIDLTHIIDTSGAYVPGHGTPTVILFGRSRGPVGDSVRAALGVRGEPETPEDAARGKVWESILRLLDSPGTENEFLTVTEVSRDTLSKHPWSVGGGGAAELKMALERVSKGILAQKVSLPIGRAVRIAQEDLYMFDSVRRRQSSAPSNEFKGFLIGEECRDWYAGQRGWVWYPYPLSTTTGSRMLGELWPWRTLLASRTTFQGVMADAGLRWYEYMQHTASAYETPLSIVFAFVATHNHFVLDRGGKVFNRSAPVIKLPADANEEDHLVLLGLLNTSVACFWLKQVCHNKGATSNSGVLQDDPERFRFEFDGSKMSKFPLPFLSESARSTVTRLARALDAAGRELGEFSFQAFIDDCLSSGRPLHTAITSRMADRASLRSQMVRWQEELDWLTYEIYGITEIAAEARSLAWAKSPEEMEPLDADVRPYRKVQFQESAAGDVTSAMRKRLIETDRYLALLERPEYKRRWFRSAGAYDATNLEDSAVLERDLRSWLLDRLESPRYWPTAELTSCARLADAAGRDPQFHQVASYFRGREDYDRNALVTELVCSEAVPYLPMFVFKPSGLNKHAQWEQVWAMQRSEDSGEKVASIPVPPKYTSADFLEPSYWRLRGKLNVPKERFVCYPKAERESDPSPVIGWAGWNHLERAQALAGYYLRAVDEGASSQRLLLLLKGLEELVPWIRQWHPEVEPGMGLPMADFFASFLSERVRELGLSGESTSDDSNR